MDLGGFLGGVVDLGSAYIGARYGGQTPPQQFMPVNSPIIPDVLENPLRSYLDAPPTTAYEAVPVAPGSANDPMKGMVWNPRANNGQGAWQKRCRKRRKRLASKSDLADLASLKGILGQGKLMEVWIATH